MSWTASWVESLNSVVAIFLLTNVDTTNDKRARDNMKQESERKTKNSRTILTRWREQKSESKRARERERESEREREKGKDKCMQVACGSGASWGVISKSQDSISASLRPIQTGCSLWRCFHFWTWLGRLRRLGLESRSLEGALSEWTVQSAYLQAV